MEEKNNKNLRVVVCQTKPDMLKKKENISRYDLVISKLKQEDTIDLMVFPEMAFSGYNFQDKQHVLPMAVLYGQGDEFEYCRALSLKLNCYVLFGYV